MTTTTIMPENFYGEKDLPMKDHQDMDTAVAPPTDERTRFAAARTAAVHACSAWIGRMRTADGWDELVSACKGMVMEADMARAEAVAQTRSGEVDWIWSQDCHGCRHFRPGTDHGYGCTLYQIAVNPFSCCSSWQEREWDDEEDA